MHEEARGQLIALRQKAKAAEERLPEWKRVLEYIDETRKDQSTYEELARLLTDAKFVKYVVQRRQRALLGLASEIFKGMTNGRYSITTTRLEETFGLRSGKDFFVGEQDCIEQFPVIQSAYAPIIPGLELASQGRFILNQPVPIEETRHYEFKEVKGPNPVNAIKNVADEYAVAFLNSEGGRIFWDIRDSDRMVVGVRLDFGQRDEVSRIVTEKLFNIQPAVAPQSYRLEFHQVYEHGLFLTCT
jgi:hypothetical protein